jgi:hypothetical protein
MRRRKASIIFIARNEEVRQSIINEYCRRIGKGRGAEGVGVLRRARDNLAVGLKPLSSIERS